MDENPITVDVLYPLWFERNWRGIYIHHAKTYHNILKF